MLRVLQEDKMTRRKVKSCDVIVFFCSVLTRSYGYNNAAFLKLENEGSQNVAHSVTDYIGHAWMDGQSTKKVFAFKMSRFGRSLKAITISTLKFC